MCAFKKQHSHKCLRSGWTFFGEKIVILDTRDAGNTCLKTAIRIYFFFFFSPNQPNLKVIGSTGSVVVTKSIWA